MRVGRSNYERSALMTRSLLAHARRHVIAYLALVISLLSMGGAAYASLQIPNASVGEKQIKNRVIDPVKWDPNYTTGFVRRWATVNSSGALMSTSPGGQSKSIGTGAAVVTWGDAFAGWCAPVATVLGGSANPSSWSATAASGSSTTSAPYSTPTS